MARALRAALLALLPAVVVIDLSTGQQHPQWSVQAAVAWVAARPAAAATPWCVAWGTDAVRDADRATAAAAVGGAWDALAAGAQN